MKNLFRIALLPILLLTLLLLLTGCDTNLAEEEGLVVGQSYHLESGETLNRDLTVIGGNATLEEESTVNGDVAVVGGNVTINGKVNGEVSVLGGYVFLDDQAVVKGAVNSLGGTVERSSQAIVEGNSDTESSTPPPQVTLTNPPNMQISFDPITGPLMAIFQALALAALAMLANLFLPAYMERTGQAAQNQPFGTGGVGCLTLLVLMVMTITIILIPISAIGFMVAGAAALFGWLALGLLLGRQIAVWLKQAWSEPVTAGVGTLVLSLAASLINVIPCIGWIFSVAVGLVALGAVVLTRFGTQVYPVPYSSAATAPYTAAHLSPQPAVSDAAPGAPVVPEPPAETPPPVEPA